MDKTRVTDADKTTQNKGDNFKLGALKNQMGDLDQDFEDMKRNREEARKQLEAKFQDVYRRIQATRDYVTAEGKRINDLLVAFQLKFQHQLNDFKTNMQNDFDKEVEHNRVIQKQNEETMAKLEEMINQEREDRLRQTDETLKPIREKLGSLQDQLDNEKSTRVEREKEILQKLDDEVFQLNERMDKEVTDRSLATGQLKDQIRSDTKTQNKWIEKFQKEAMEEFELMKEEIEDEMKSRFEHQDEIVDNMSNFIKTFQDTLKVVAGDK
mmetsp:Transcript_38440/g.43648  ORF Transcript_38440/g.43648 Transcript_38440/m.43648 type:complete len:268 (-) Transcript_38440:78-881(-)